MNVEIANKLINLRKEKGFSQEELAEKIGISRQAVSKWERAESSPDTDNLIALARLYEISLDELLLMPGEKAERIKTPPPAAAPYAPDYGPKEGEHEDENRRKGGMFLFPYPVVTVILFFVLTFTNTGWGSAWLIFLTIPIYYGIAEIVYRRKRESAEDQTGQKRQ